MSVENANCSVCHKFVRSGIFCNICNTWVHPKCNQLNYKEFKQFQKSKGKYTRYDFSYDFCRIRRVVPCIHSKSYKKLSYQQSHTTKKKVKHV